MTRRRTALFAVLLLWMGAAIAHEVRPAYLQLREASPGVFEVLWKTPMVGDARLALAPVFPAGAAPASPVRTRQVPGAAVMTWTLNAAGLRGQPLAVRGLEGTMTDVLVRLEFADGTSWTHRLTPSRPAATIPERESALAVAALYLGLGVEHILLGIDHLLFVLALLILAQGTWPLVKTITAFTVAHSITLGLATLGVVHVPQQPVEALIALSIAFVAAEIVRGGTVRQSLAWRAPWLVAFAFGLLHGLGFAGALRETGLPEHHISVALLFFNVGVEVGQLVFVAAVLGAWALVRRMSGSWREARATPGAARALSAAVPAYAIGIVSMFWVFERIAGFRA